LASVVKAERSITGVINFPEKAAKARPSNDAKWVPVRGVRDPVCDDVRYAQSPAVLPLVFSIVHPAAVPPSKPSVKTIEFAVSPAVAPPVADNVTIVLWQMVISSWFRLTASGAALTVNEVAELAVPLGVVTAITPVTVPAAVIAVISESLLTEKEVALTPPTVTAVAAVNPVPVIVISVPDAQPAAGENAVTPGAACRILRGEATPAIVVACAPVNARNAALASTFPHHVFDNNT